jgi:archaeal flagellin FlaB
MNSLHHDEDGFTGLEAAIVLIAFVVVAAVFSYVVLGAGFFTTQKSQEVVHTGVQQASSTLQIMGDVYGIQDATDGQGCPDGIDYINFTVSLAPGGTPVDMNKTTITYSNTTKLQTLAIGSDVGVMPGPGYWGVSATRNNNGGTANYLLEKGEQFDITAYPSNANYIPKNEPFTIEVKPIIGAALDIKRTAPAAINVVQVLY